MMNKTKESTCVRTADVIAMYRGKIVLINRLKFPLGLALPGGHIDQGENRREAAIREFKEETGLTLNDVTFFVQRRGKRRDPRYVLSETSVYQGVASGNPKNERGFTEVVLLSQKEVLQLAPEKFAFDHHKILMHFLKK